MFFDFDGDSKTGKAAIKLHEGQPPFAVNNNTVIQDRCFKDAHVGKWDQVQRSALAFNGVKVRMNGCVSRDFKATMCLPVEAHELDRYLKFVLRIAMKNNGVHVPMVVVDTMELGCTEKFQYAASSLSKLLELALKDSHNLVTDALFSKVTQKKGWPRN